MKGIAYIKSQLDSIPTTSGIYKYFDINKNIIYIGKAKNLKSRITQYAKDNLAYRTGLMVFQITNIEYITTPTEAEALLLESSLIKKFKPKYNILLKDDKSFPYMAIKDSLEYPLITKYRGKKLEDAKYFGPFTSGLNMNKTLIEVQKIFKLRTCSDYYFKTRTRPCLLYQIKRCSAPCVEKISQKDYKINVEEAINFLSGKTSILQKKLSQVMNEYSNNLDYEKAAEIRDKIKAINLAQISQGGKYQIQDADIIAITNKMNIFAIEVMLYRAGINYGHRAYFPIHTQDAQIDEVLTSFLGQFYQSRPPAKLILTNIKIQDADNIIKALHTLHKIKPTITTPKLGDKSKIVKIVEEYSKISLDKKIQNTSKFKEQMNKVSELFGLKEDMERIEIYDNSHIMGKFAVGAMVVMTQDGFDKTKYRHYIIQNPELIKGDDYAMLKQVLNRRFQKIKSNKSEKPDLMIIDGGKGHMGIVEKTMQENNINIPFVCMSKGKNRNAGKETFHMPGLDPIIPDYKSEVMHFLQIMRDEVHNYAIKNYRSKHRRSFKVSSLDSLKGIGKYRKSSLLSHFGSFDAIKEASIEDLSKVEGIGLNTAKDIYDIIHK